MRGIDPKSFKRYVVEDERDLPPEEQTVFHLKNLTMREMEQLRNCLFATETGTPGRKKKLRNRKERFYLGTQERLSLEIGLIGWDNFKDDSGRDIPFSKENIDCIPAQYRAELAVEIRGETDKELTEDEAKNFESGQTSTDSPSFAAETALT